MVILVRLLGIAVTVLGIVFLLDIKKMKKYMDFWTKGKDPHIRAGVSSVAFSVLLLLAASQCKSPLIIIFMAIWGLVKGIVIIVRGPKGLKSMAGWIEKKPANALRLFAILALAVGILIVSSA